MTLCLSVCLSVRPSVEQIDLDFGRDATSTYPTLYYTGIQAPSK